MWFFFTPELQSTIVGLSSPCTLLVALFGMTTAKTLVAMKTARMSLLSKMSWYASRAGSTVPGAAMPMVQDIA